MTGEIVKFNFKGDDLDIVRLDGGDVGAILVQLCDRLDIDAEGQRQRLSRRAQAGAKWACTFVVKAQVGGQLREVVVLPRRSLPMWAATIDPSRVRADIRPKLVAYQDEAAEALAVRFLPPPPMALAEVATLATSYETLMSTAIKHFGKSEENYREMAKAADDRNAKELERGRRMMKFAREIQKELSDLTREEQHTERMAYKAPAEEVQRARVHAQKYVDGLWSRASMSQLFKTRAVGIANRAAEFLEREALGDPTLPSRLSHY